jgi:membrane-anchored protein YejM (alkaline phosphatase superfamily)
MCNWGHGSNFARQQLQTPLVIFGLDRPKQTISYRTSSLDISATIMQDILGCKNPVSDYSAGQNLFDPTERKFIFSSGYLENTIIYEDKVFVQTAYGAMQKYTLDGKFINDPLPPGAAKKFFDMMKNYSK